MRQKSIGQIYSQKNPSSPTNYFSSAKIEIQNTFKQAKLTPSVSLENSLESCLLRTNFASSNEEVVNVFLNFKKQQDEKQFAQNIK